MDAIFELRCQAILKRNAAIQAAKREYTLTLKEIAVLQRRLNVRSPRAPRSPVSARSLVAVAREILLEGKPLPKPTMTMATNKKTKPENRAKPSARLLATTNPLRNPSK